MKMEQTECSETSAYKIQTPENYPEEIILQIVLNFLSNWPASMHFAQLFPIPFFSSVTQNYFRFTLTYPLAIYLVTDFIAHTNSTLINVQLPPDTLINPNVHPSTWMLYSEINPTKCNNCFILRNGFTLHVSGDNSTHHQEYICCIWPQVGRYTYVVILSVLW